MSTNSITENNSSVISRRRSKYKHRRTVFTPPPKHLSELLTRATRAGLTYVRIYLSESPSREIAGLREWANEVPEGWKIHERGLYLQGRYTFVLRYVSAKGETVEIRPAAEWFGEGGTSRDHEQAWLLLGDIGRMEFNDGIVLASPAVTGRDWWVRTLPFDNRHVAPPPEICDLIRETTGQGRFEVCRTEPLPASFEYDGRLMYLALMRELPGDFVSLDPVTKQEIDFYDRARYEITVTVPDGWDHVGLVGRFQKGPGWDYPAEPGTQWRTWVDGVELHLLERQGWLWEPHQRMLFERSKPLDAFARNMLRIIAELDEERPDDGAHVRMCARALRLLAISTLGSFVGRGYLIDREQNIWDGPLPDGAKNVRTENGKQYFQTLVEATDRGYVQPHWAAAVWARARVRLLTGPPVINPGEIGALHVPRDNVIGFLLDAIYLTEKPSWGDAGKAGQFRLKGESGPGPAPLNTRELSQGTSNG